MFYEKERHLGVKDLSSFEDFIESHFVETISTDYPDLMYDILSGFPERIEPAYLQFLSRTLLMAAEYGMSGCAGISYRHQMWGSQMRVERDFLHPYHVAETAVYLANINLASQEFKQEALSYVRELDIDVEPATLVNAVMSRWIRPYHGQVEYPEVKDLFFEDGIHTDRLRLADRIPLLMPDYGFMEQVSQINLTKDVADSITVGDFNQTFLPKIKHAFAGIKEIESVFTNPYIY